MVIGLGEGIVKVFDLPSNKERLSVKKHEETRFKASYASEVCGVKFVNDGRNILSAGRDTRQIVWDAKTGERSPF